MKVIAQGAEAHIILDKNIIKDRITKSYRLKVIDDNLRKARTKREAKMLKKLEVMKFPAPRLVKTDEQKIEMEFIEGKTLRDVLDSKNCISLCEELGRKIRFLHENNIVHGDLTTSNMILNDEIYFIDFGLSFVSTKVEDKAVDLHLLKQALESKHHRIWEDCFNSAIKGYGDSEVISRLVIVEKRGRNKQKS